MEILVGDVALSQYRLRFLSFNLLFMAIIIAWMPYERSISFLGIWTWNLTVPGSIPDLIAGFIGILIVMPLYTRNIVKWRVTSVYSILSLVVNVTLVSTFCKIILGDGFSFNLLSCLLITAVALSWFGMRSVTALIWVLVCLLGVASLLHRNYVMGVYGYMFILCGFLGLVLQSEMKPGEIFTELTQKFRS